MKWPEILKTLFVITLAASGALAQERYNSDAYREATAGLMCQCGGCNATVGTCSMEHCHSSEPIKEEIASRLQNGESVQSILDVFSERYGLAILAAPPVEGFHVAAWLAPLFALVVGFFITRHVLGSWRRQTVAAGHDGASNLHSLSEADRARIEKELRDLPS